jgi:ribosomal protein S18 acetylase RimI-like enzyme
MRYRIATKQDLPQLAALRWDFRNEDGHEKPIVSREAFLKACVEFLRQGLESGHQVYWLAENEGEIIAHIFAHRIDLVPRPCKLKDQFGYITNNYTKPAYRNQGIGSKLMAYVRKWAADEDYELLIVHPSDEAVSFYERAGFVAENDVLELVLRAYY